MKKIFNFQSKLVEKIQIAETDYKLKYEIPADFTFTPGQFIGVRVMPTHTRAYSIVNAEGNLLELLIDVKPGGIASKYFEKVQIGDESQILGPYGIYGIKSDLPNKVFISTGTGIAPFIPMINSLDLLTTKAKLLFGTRANFHDIAYQYFKDMQNDNFEYYQCVTREEPQMPYSFKGRVNIVLDDMLMQKLIDPLFTEFYICGADYMIKDVIEVLKGYGANKIYFEKY